LSSSPLSSCLSLCSLSLLLSL